ncbi:MAG: FtsX-like permease family protein [Planctomycetes bacterium]|nr:FtsX-like permease family protein [Planctomycetota bacterium]
MFVLNRKLLRDAAAGAGTLVTVVAIMAVGTGVYVGMRSAQRILSASQADYYRSYRFADFWIDVKKAPLSAAESIARLPGMAALEARVVFDVILDLPGEVEPLSGRLISAPARGFDRTLNGICLVRGAGFSDDREAEAIIGEAFARAHHLEPGDRVSLILNGKLESFIIAGTAISPEYVYMVRGVGDFIPDPKHFGILYVKADYARRVLDFQDACNQVVGRLVDAGGEGEDLSFLLARIERMLDPYGVLAVVPRERQASNRFLSDEIRSLGITALIMPTIFLFIAALVLNVVTSRLAERQRTVIGTLKALGYSNRQVLVHFLSFGLLVGLAGGLTGCGFGILLARGMMELYKSFFQFPRFAFYVYPDLLAAAVGISLVFAVGGTAKGVRRVLRLQPAEAMRPRPPERGGAVLLERFPRLWRALGFRTHVALRGLARNRGRTITGMIASTLSVAIIFMALGMADAVRFLLEFQFDRVLHSDVDIGMQNERSIAAVYEGQSLPGVDRVEPVLGVSCDLRRGRVSRRLSITGLAPRHGLTTPVAADLRPIDIPEAGIVLTRKLAEIFGVNVGDEIEMTPVRGQRRTVPVRVGAIVEGLVGLECYADLRYLSRLVGEATAVNALQLAVSAARQPELFRAIKRLPNAQGLSVRANTRDNIRDTFIRTMRFSITSIILFAGIIAFGSVLNSSLIEIGDRMRDIATFRVLGYKPGAIAGIFFRQNVVVVTVGLVVGLPLGYCLLRLIAHAYNTELFRMHVAVGWRSVSLTAVLTLLFVLAAQIVVYRQIVRLDWLEGVKVKE